MFFNGDAQKLCLYHVSKETTFIDVMRIRV